MELHGATKTSGTGGGISTVTDGTTTVTSATTLTIVGGTVSNLGGGNAQVTFTGSGSGTVTSISSPNNTLVIGTPTTTPTIDLNLANSNVFTASQGVNISNITNVPTDGFLLENTTPSTSVAPLQFSPSLHFDGSAWNTGSLASNDVSIRQMMGTTSNATPSGTWQLQASTNGSAYTNVLQVTTGGSLIGSGNVTFNGSLSTSTGTTTGSNLFIGGSTTSANSAVAQYQFASSSSVNYRSAFYGSASTSITAGANYSSVIFANAPITTPASGTNVWLANVVIRPIGTITISGTTPTNAASLFIDGAPTGATNNYAINVASGNSQFGGAVTATGNVTAATMIVGNNQAYTGGSTDQAFSLQTRNFTASNTAVSAITGTVTNSTGQFNGFAITPTYNQTSTASATDFLINRTETAVGSGAQLFVNFQISGSSKFNIDHAGAITTTSLTNGLVKSTSGLLSNATAGTDYLTALTGAVTSSGNATSLGSFTSAQLSGAVTDETGSGSAVFATSPTIATLSTTGNISMASNTFINSGGNLLIGGNGTNTLFRPNSSGGQIQFQNFSGIQNNLVVNDGGGASLIGSLSLTVSGSKINVATGTNASVGTATLVGGTVTVSTTAVTASSKIFLTDATTGTLTNIGTPTVGTVTAGTSFVINSSNVLDTSNINWFIIN